MDTDRQLRETAAEIQESAQCESQRKAFQNSELSLLLPAHVFHALTGGHTPTESANGYALKIQNTELMILMYTTI